MWGCKGDCGSSGTLLALILALAGTAVFLLFALLGGYLLALGAVVLIVLTPVALAELELYEWTVGSGTGSSQAPEAPAQAEGPAQLSRPTAEAGARPAA